MIFNKFESETSERTIKALIGITKPQFYKLRDVFDQTYLEHQQERVKNGEIKHVPKGGPKGHLYCADKKLFFLLYYLKTYCTFDVLGFHFGFSSGHAHQHVEHLMPVLQRSLSKLNVLPMRALASPESLRQLVEIYGDLAIDGVEVACVRPQDDEQQKAHYSGKKNDTLSSVS